MTGEFPAQRASNAENLSISWRHHDLQQTDDGFSFTEIYINWIIEIKAWISNHAYVEVCAIACLCLNFNDNVFQSP